MALAFPSTSVKRLVQVLQWVTWLWFIILISSFFAGLVFTKPLLRLAYDTWLINFEGDWLGPVQGLGLWPIMAMTTLPSLYAIWSLNRFLTEVLQGRTFSIRAIKGFRFFSLGIVIAAIAYVWFLVGPGQARITWALGYSYAARKTVETFRVGSGDLG